VATAQTTEDTFPVELPCFSGDTYGDGWYDETCSDDPLETINIPSGRPIYALLVSGFHQNRNLDMFHFYNFARCLQQKGAYVHFAWWNNLLAPYMERPLHNPASVPSVTGNPWYAALNLLAIPNIVRPKAIPRDDYQFQADAERLLNAIRDDSPDAAIILVGHSMGGDAVARLAENTNVDIALLAPIDPVGNRSCLPWPRNWPLQTPCFGQDNFTRAQTVHTDWIHTDYDLAEVRNFKTNVKFLYHRWQIEALPPYDWWRDEQLFSYHGGNLDRVTSLEAAIELGSTNIQAKVVTRPGSGDEVPLLIGNVLGLADGHGEIVGFRGVIPVISTDPLNIFSVESYPLALDARGGWPRGQGCDEAKTDAECRRYHMGKWESDPGYLYKKGYEPYNPGLCMVSGDLCNILDIVVADTNVNAPPVADAGPDQILECSSPNGTEVMLDGSGSTDPEGDPLSFSWSGPFGDWIGQTIYPKLPVGTHSITLTVDDGNGNTDTDTLSVTVADTTPPSLSVSLSPTSLWPPNHKMRPINASIRTSDACDAAPNVKLVSIISSQPDNGVGDGNTNNDIQGASFGTDDRTFLLRAEVSGKGARQRIYTVTYSSTDALGNVGEDGSASVTVTQSRAQPRDSLR
jgi:pimeloyl-ACP methyl ester carboxylesterase